MTQFFNMKKEYWREHYAVPVPTDGLICYHPLSYIGQPTVMANDMTFAYGSYTKQLAEHNGVKCTENTDAVLNANMAVCSSPSVSRRTSTSTIMVHLTNLPNGSLYIQPNIIGVAMTNGAAGNLYWTMGGGSMALWANNAAQWYAHYTKTWAINKWYMFTLVCTPTAAKLYIDGSLATRKDYAFGTRTSSYYLFGFQLPANTAFAHFALHERELSQAEITSLYQKMVQTA